TSPAPGTYRIVNRNSGKPLAIAGNSTADGAKAVQQTGGGTWTLNASGSAFTLRYNPTGKVLDVNGFSSTAGLQLQQWTVTGGTNQQWYLRPTGDGYFTIVSHDSGLAADVNGQSKNDGAAVVQWTANNGANQQWQLTPA
ncbi:RICIN domain-containing protein, partial [Streptomyces acidiscabies]|uniref:RICIN domain-containing protein n=1 Tax=Streptomyces acidiscabies TaxID=42234 RepID=UPI00095162A7